MSIKLLVLAVLAITAGLVFVAVGIYFLTAGFLKKLNESAPEQSEQVYRKNEFRAKGSGLTSIALGALTVFWGIMIFMFPSITAALGLIYMFFLIAAFAVLVVVFK